MKRIKLKLSVRGRPSSLAPTPPTVSPATTSSKADKNSKRDVGSERDQYGRKMTKAEVAWRDRCKQPHPPKRAKRNPYKDNGDEWDFMVKYKKAEGWAATDNPFEEWKQQAQDNIDKFIKRYGDMGLDGIKAEYKKEVEGYVSPTYANTAFRANPTKNANNDVVTCLDDSRVMLADNTYINASWAYDTKHKEKPEYILAQMPNESTYEDFWQMVYEHKACLVVAVGVPEDKRVRGVLWPDTQDWLHFGKMAVLKDQFHLIDWMDYRVDDLEVTKKGRDRIQETGGVQFADLFKINGWASLAAMLEAIEIVDLYHVNRRGPIIVVDSDGGCTLASVLVLADMVGTRLVEKAQPPSLPALTQWLRRCRNGAIPTPNEYLRIIQVVFHRILDAEHIRAKKEFYKVRVEKPNSTSLRNYSYKEVPNKWFNKLQYEKEYRTILGNIYMPKWPTREEQIRERLQKELKKEKSLKEMLAKKKLAASKESAVPSKESAVPSKESVGASKEAVDPAKGKDAGSKENAAEQKK